jgi:O-antigen biosynthesis protein
MKKTPKASDQVLQHLDEADAMADLEHQTFLMSQYPKLFRPLARLAAWAVQYAARAVTIRQRQFNRHILEAVRLLAQTPAKISPSFPETMMSAEEIVSRAEKELDEFLASDEVIEIPEVARPEVSVLLVLHNRAELTLNCLRSLLRSTFKSLEIIIVDNASSDKTDPLLQRIRGARIFRNSTNVNFVLGANQAAKESTGRFLLFLNSDTQLDPFAIEAAMAIYDERPRAGAVGARLIHGTGRLQEAGALVWRSGSCHGVGRGEAPDSSAFSFRRLTDYVSGAFLLTPRNLFESVGGFDTRFSPAYCEDVDYCLTLWQKGKEVIYEPDAIVLHLEGSSSPEHGKAVEQMRVNQEKIGQKHHEWLTANHLLDSSKNILRASFARYSGKRILFLEDRVPHPEFGSGFPRSQSIIRLLAEGGNFVTCYPTRFPHESSMAARSVLGNDVEVVSSLGLAGLEGFLQRRAGIYDVLWISRPNNMEILAPILRAHPAWFEGTRVIYDAEAIYCLREIEYAKLMGKEIRPEAVAKRVAKELEPARKCDAVVVASTGEKAWCEQLGFKNTQVISSICELSPDMPGFDERQGIIFVGPVLEDVCPNADSIERLICGIFPAIAGAMGSKAQLSLVGFQGSKRIRQMIRKYANEQIHVLGQVPSTGSYLLQARVFVAPTRYASGIPIKILEAAAHGVPIVATSLLAAQLGWNAGRELLVADSDEEIAAACVRLHEDEALWTRLRDAVSQRILREYHPDACSATLRILLGSTTPA